MTQQYQQPSINTQGNVSSTFVIQSISDLDAIAPAQPDGARVISTPEGAPGIELQIRGQIELPDGEHIVDDTARGDQQGVTFSGRSANLDGIRGNVVGGLIAGTNGVIASRLRFSNSNPAGFCIQVGNLIDNIIGVPEFRASNISTNIFEGSGGGILLSTPGVFPAGETTIGVLIEDATFRCDVFGIRFENPFTAGVRIQGIVNLAQTPGLEVIQFAVSAVASLGPVAIRDSSIFANTGVPGDIRAIVFDDVSVIENFAIIGCGFDVADPADAIYDNTTAAAVVPGVGSAANLISEANILLDTPPVLIAQNPV